MHEQSLRGINVQNKNICIVSIVDDKKLHECVYQLISKSRDLDRDHDYNITAIIIGDLLESDKTRLFRSGAKKVICCKCPKEGIVKYEEILYDLLKNESLIMFPSLDKERSCAAKLATKLGASLTAECIDVSIDDKYGFVFSRAAMSNSVIADIICVNTNISMCTVKNHMFIESSDYSINPEYVTNHYEEYNYDDDQYVDHNIVILERVWEEVEDSMNTDLENAKIIFGIGRGAKDDKTLTLIKEIADKIGAVLVGTRACVEENIIDHKWQVGQSGTSVKPDLYVAFGISGAIQHMVGLTRAKQIIAINKDGSAPIFNYADYGVISDCYELLLALKKKIASK